jgi:glycosyltransferase involved in cell wall biosynthesis
MTQPLVSVVIPTKDRPEMLTRAVQSVLDQTYDPIELHIVDDGSTPPAREAIAGLPTEELAGFECHRHETNRGGNAARKTGVEAATGEYVAFLDDDDEWLSEKTERQVSTLQETASAGVAYTQNRQLISPNQPRSIHRPGPGGDIAERILFGNYIGGYSVVMMEAGLFDSVGVPDEQFPAWQDWELHIRLAQETEYVSIADPLVDRHVGHADRISPGYDMKREIAPRMFETRLKKPAREHGIKTEVRAALKSRLARAAQLEERYTTARSHFASAVRFDPRNRSYYIYLLALSGGRFTFVPARKLKHIVSRYT